MTGERVFAVMIEPPLSVANGLVEATRRYFGASQAQGQKPHLLPPERYGVPLIVCPVEADRSPDVVAMALNAAVRDLPEFAVQLDPLSPVEGSPGVVGSVLRARDQELAELVAALKAAFERVGLDGAQCPSPVLPVAVVAEEEATEAGALAPPTGEAAAQAGEAVAQASEARDVPLAGWLVAGLCAAEGTPGPGPGTWLLTRTATRMLRRPGSR
jgi:hypothetical protein